MAIAAENVIGANAVKRQQPAFTGHLTLLPGSLHPYRSRGEARPLNKLAATPLAVSGPFFSAGTITIRRSALSGFFDFPHVRCLVGPTLRKHGAIGAGTYRHPRPVGEDFGKAGLFRADAEKTAPIRC